MNIMNLTNMFSLMVLGENEQGYFCSQLIPVWTVVGYVIFAIKIVVPLLLIVTGMITLAQAVMKQKAEEIKTAQQLLIKKIIAAVLVFFVVTIVTLIVNLVSDGADWKSCAQCATNPFKPEYNCSLTVD